MKLSRILIQTTFKVKKVLNTLSKLLLIAWKEFGINIQKILISLKIPKYGEMKIVVEFWRIINIPKDWKIRKYSRVQLGR